jgi:predicted nucleotidyltransferase
MEDYMKERPAKIILSKSGQKKILEKIKRFVLKDLLPNPKINKIILYGSLAKGTFGKYVKPFKNRIYSDADVILFVENDFKVPKKWKKHVMADLYQIYNVAKLDKKFLIQYVVCRKSSYQNKKNQKEAEKWGTPIALKKSKHKFIVLYERA